MSILEKLKQSSTKEEKVELLKQFLDIKNSSEINEDTITYIRSRKDLTDLLSEMKSSNKVSLKSLMSKIDKYNKENHPELVPTDPNSLEERINLMNQHNKTK